MASVKGSIPNSFTREDILREIGKLDLDLKSVMFHDSPPESRNTLFNCLKGIVENDKWIFEKDEDYAQFACDVEEIEARGTALYFNLAKPLLDREYCTQCNAVIMYDTFDQNTRNRDLDKFHVKQTDFEEYERQLKRLRGKKKMKRLTAKDIEKQIQMLVFEKKNLRASPEIYSLKYSYNCHLDSVRALCFSGNEDFDVFFTASEDYTVKMWTLHRKQLLRRRRHFHAPLHVFRGHTDGVCALTCGDDYLFSGGFDGTIRMWEIPVDGHDHDPKENYGTIGSFERTVVTDCKDIIWFLDRNPKMEQVISACADGHIRNYEYSDDEMDLLCDWDCVIDGVSHSPSCVRYVYDNYLPNQVVVSFTDACFAVYDIEANKMVQMIKTVKDFEFSQNDFSHLVYQALPLRQRGGVVLTCNEDTHVRVWDVKSGKQINSDPIKHADAVTSLAENRFHPSFASADHDCNVRTWDTNTWKIIQNFQSGRPKGEEGIHSISYHPTKDYYLGVASADGIVKLWCNNKEPKLNEEERIAREKFLKEEKKKRKKEKRKKKKKKKRKSRH